MKRSLDKKYECEKLVNFQRRNQKDENELNKKSNKDDLKEINNVLYDIFIEDNMVDIIININTKNKEICINENINEKEKNRKYKYGKNLESMIDVIYDDFMYKNINSLLLYLDNRNLFVNKEKWRDQLLNEILYMDILEEENKKEDELISLLETSLIDLKLN